jgi:hypothetical protein
LILEFRIFRDGGLYESVFEILSLGSEEEQ